MSGQKKIFYIDAPGPHTVVTFQKLQVDSATFVLNLSAHLCRKDNPNICELFPWFTKIIVKPDANLDGVNSVATRGKASTKF